MEEDTKKRVLLGLPGSFQGEYVLRPEELAFKQKIEREKEKEKKSEKQIPIWLQSDAPKSPNSSKDSMSGQKMVRVPSSQTPTWLSKSDPNDGNKNDNNNSLIDSIVLPETKAIRRQQHPSERNKTMPQIPTISIQKVKDGKEEEESPKEEKKERISSGKKEMARPASKYRPNTAFRPDTHQIKRQRPHGENVAPSIKQQLKAKDLFANTDSPYVPKPHRPPNLPSLNSFGGGVQLLIRNGEISVAKNPEPPKKEESMFEKVKSKIGILGYFKAKKKKSDLKNQFMKDLERLYG